MRLTAIQRRALLHTPLWHASGDTYVDTLESIRVRGRTVRSLLDRRLIYWSVDGCLDTTGKGEAACRRMQRAEHA